MFHCGKHCPALQTFSYSFFSDLRPVHSNTFVDLTSQNENYNKVGEAENPDSLCTILQMLSVCSSFLTQRWQKYKLNLFQLFFSTVFNDFLLWNEKDNLRVCKQGFGGRCFVSGSKGVPIVLAYSKGVENREGCTTSLKFTRRKEGA